MTLHPLQQPELFQPRFPMAAAGESLQRQLPFPLALCLPAQFQQQPVPAAGQPGVIRGCRNRLPNLVGEYALVQPFPALVHGKIQVDL